MPGPTRGRRARVGQHLRERLAGRRRRVPARGPCDDPTRFPRDLNLDDPGLEVTFPVGATGAIVAAGSIVAAGLGAPGAGRGLRRTLTGVSRPRLREPAVLRLEIGNDLLALFPA